MRPTTDTIPRETTVRVHIEPRVRLGHNLRDPLVVAKEPHIDPHGSFSILKNIDPEELWEATFGDAIEAYDARQRRKDRRIGGASAYYEKVKRETRKTSKTCSAAESSAPLYDIVVSVGNISPAKDETGAVVLDEDGHVVRPYLVPDFAALAIIRKFLASFEEENDHFKVFCVVIHCDEPGVIHAHVSGFGVADGYKRGPALQCSISKACEQMGHKGRNRHDNPVSVWAKSLRARLEDITHDVLPGVEIVHPDEGRNKTSLEHLVYRQKKLTEEVAALERKKAALLQEINSYGKKRRVYGSGGRRVARAPEL